VWVRSSKEARAYSQTPNAMVFEAFYKTFMSRSSVYVGVVIAGALVGEKVVNNGFDTLWESRNKGKLYKHIVGNFPELEEE